MEGTGEMRTVASDHLLSKPKRETFQQSSEVKKKEKEKKKKEGEEEV